MDINKTSYRVLRGSSVEAPASIGIVTVGGSGADVHNNLGGLQGAPLVSIITLLNQIIIRW